MELKGAQPLNFSQIQQMKQGMISRLVQHAPWTFFHGCVLFEALTETRRHLFGGMWERQQNSLDGRIASPHAQLSDDVLGVGANELILAMTSPQPDKRPSAQELVNHPAFWSTDRWLRFLEEFSDRAGHQDDYDDDNAGCFRASQMEILDLLESLSSDIIGARWDNRLGPTRKQT